MNKVIKKSFQTLVKNSAIMQPLIFYIIIMLVFSGFMGSRVFSNPALGIIFSAIMLLLLTAFLSGWYNTIKFAVDNYKDFDKKSQNYSMKVAVYNLDTGKNFFPGVGEYFGSILFVVIVYMLICGLIFTFCNRFFNIDNNQMYSILFNREALMEYTKSNPMKISAYILSVSSIIQIFQFVIMFWVPSILYETKNPLRALFSSLKFLFKNFWYSVGLYFFIVICIFLMNILNVLCSINYILSIIFVIFELYFITYVFVLLFAAYKLKLIQKQIEKVNSKDVFIKSKELKESNDAQE